MQKELTRKQLETLYLPPRDEFVMVDVPELPYFMIDGEGSPDDDRFKDALKWLWMSVAPVKREARRRMGRNFVEPPLEGLWWADDMRDLVNGVKDRFKWRLMVPAPGWATLEMYADAIAEVEESRGPAPDGLRLDRYDEGMCVQIMHVGPNEHELTTLHRLHHEYLPAHGFVAEGPHNEIYLTDPSRTAPEKRKTVLRQPVITSSA